MTLDEFLQLFDKYKAQGYNDIESYHMAEEENFALYRKYRYTSFDMFKRTANESIRIGRIDRPMINVMKSTPPGPTKIKVLRKKDYVEPPKKKKMTQTEFTELVDSLIGHNGRRKASEAGKAYEMAELEHIKQYGARRFKQYKSFINTYYKAQVDARINNAVKS